MAVAEKATSVRPLRLVSMAGSGNTKMLSMASSSLFSKKSSTSIIPTNKEDGFQLNGGRKQNNSEAETALDVYHLGCDVHRCSCQQFRLCREEGTCGFCSHGAMYHTRRVQDEREIPNKSSLPAEKNKTEKDPPITVEKIMEEEETQKIVAEILQKADEFERKALMKCAKADNCLDKDAVFASSSSPLRTPSKKGGNDKRVALYREAFQLCVQGLDLLSAGRIKTQQKNLQNRPTGKNTAMMGGEKIVGDYTAATMKENVELLQRMEILMTHCERIKNVMDTFSSSATTNTPVCGEQRCLSSSPTAAAALVTSPKLKHHPLQQKNSSTTNIQQHSQCMPSAVHTFDVNNNNNTISSPFSPAPIYIHNSSSHEASMMKIVPSRLFSFSSHQHQNGNAAPGGVDPNHPSTPTVLSPPRDIETMLRRCHLYPEQDTKTTTSSAVRVNVNAKNKDNNRNEKGMGRQNSFLINTPQEETSLRRNMNDGGFRLQSCSNERENEESDVHSIRRMFSSSLHHQSTSPVRRLSSQSQQQQRFSTGGVRGVLRLSSNSSVGGGENLESSAPCVRCKEMTCGNFCHQCGAKR